MVFGLNNRLRDGLTLLGMASITLSLAQNANLALSWGWFPVGLVTFIGNIVGTIFFTAVGGWMSITHNKTK